MHIHQIDCYFCYICLLINTIDDIFDFLNNHLKSRDPTASPLSTDKIRRLKRILTDIIVTVSEIKINLYPAQKEMIIIDYWASGSTTSTTIFLFLGTYNLY